MNWRLFTFGALAAISLAAPRLSWAAVGIPSAPTGKPVEASPIEPPIPASTAPVPGSLPMVEFQGEKIDVVLRTLAQQAKINVVISDQVSEGGDTLTMRMEDKSPREAIEIIVQAKDLIMDERNGVYFIKTQRERSMEPVQDVLKYATEDMLGPLARFKGEYYKQLVASGVPAATASEIVLHEEISPGILSPSRGKSDKSDASDKSESEKKSTSTFSWPGLGNWAEVGTAVVTLLGGIPAFLLHFAFAIAVWVSAHHASRQRVPLRFFGPFGWACATLIGGVLVAGLYWLMHHSAARERRMDDSEVN
jgi:hypothetical protein